MSSESLNLPSENITIFSSRRAISMKSSYDFVERRSQRTNTPCPLLEPDRVLSLLSTNEVLSNCLTLPIFLMMNKAEENDNQTTCEGSLRLISPQEYENQTLWKRIIDQTSIYRHLKKSEVSFTICSVYMKPEPAPNIKFCWINERLNTAFVHVLLFQNGNKLIVGRFWVVVTRKLLCR